MFCQVGHTNSVTFATCGLVGQENGGSSTIAIFHTTCRLTMRLVSAHISQWDVKFAGECEGQYVIHFLWDMRKFL